MSNPIRVLQVFTIMDMGGAETMIMNYYRNIDRSKVQFDFLVHREKKGYYEDEIKSLGGRIFRVPALYNVFAHIKGIRQFLEEHKEYKIIHGHVSILGYFLYKEAKKSGVPVIIAHAHNNSCDFSWRWPLWMLLRYMIRPHFTHAMTCGKEAAIWTFGEKKAKHAIQLNNAIETNKFALEYTKRAYIREEHGWSKKLIICNVARFTPQKNHFFLLSIFKVILSIRPDALLVLVGDKIGLYDSLSQKVHDMRMTDKVQFLGARNDVHEILQAADVICMPSMYEGLSVSMVEAQASGLRIITSDRVPREAEVIPGAVRFVPLAASPETWADTVLEPYERKNTSEAIRSAGFDVLTNAAWLQDFYLSHHHSH